MEKHKCRACGRKRRIANLEPVEFVCKDCPTDGSSEENFEAFQAVAKERNALVALLERVLAALPTVSSELIQEMRNAIPAKPASPKPRTAAQLMSLTGARSIAWDVVVEQIAANVADGGRINQRTGRMVLLAHAALKYLEDHPGMQVAIWDSSDTQQADKLLTRVRELAACVGIDPQRAIAHERNSPYKLVVFYDED